MLSTRGRHIHAVQEIRPLTPDNLATALFGSISVLAHKNKNKKAVCFNGDVYRAPINTTKRSLARLESLPHNPSLYAWSEYQGVEEQQVVDQEQLVQQVEVGSPATAISVGHD